MEKFKFNPENGFKDVDAFPDPLNENETREQMQRLHDQLADFVNKIAPGYNGEVVMIRFDSDLRLEYSRNGVDWLPTLASGHIVLDQAGTQLPNRNRLQFKNAVIRDDAYSGLTIVECSTGEPGPGVPEGGAINQVLAKASDSSFDAVWKTMSAADVGAATTEQVNSAIEIANKKAPADHNHDTRYFTEDQTTSLLDSKANKNHASSSTVFGIGSETDFGHVKLTDSASSDSPASLGVGASPKAVKKAYDLANKASEYTAGTAIIDSVVVTSGNVSWVKCGRIVQVYMDTVKLDISKMNVAFSMHQIARGLPEPSTLFFMPLSVDYLPSVSLVEVNGNGILNFHLRDILPSRSETAITSSFIYISRE